MNYSRRILSCCVAVVMAWCAGQVEAGVDTRMNPTDLAGTVQNEVSLTLNLNPNPGVGVVGGNVNLLSAYNDQAATGLGVSYSIDSGATWTERTIGTNILDFFNNTPLSNVFDPITASDTQGNLFAGYIADTGASGSASGLYVERSTDGGNNWSGPMLVHAEDAAVNILPPNMYRSNDKPHLVADTYVGSIRQDNLYAVWIQDDGSTAPTDLRFSASADSGVTWFPVPVTINNNPGIDRANGPNLTVAPDGDVYVAWLDVDVTNVNPGPKPGALYIDHSTDGGLTWGMDKLVRNVNTLPDHLSTLGNQLSQDDVRARGFPVIEADPTDATGQTLYLTWAEDPDGAIGGDEADIFFLRSTDGGLTWPNFANPLRVNHDSTINDQFAPWMDVKPDGTIDIAWYDKRLSANDDAWDVYIARSTDGGLSFGPNVRLTDVTYNTPLASNNVEPWLGEYLGLVVDSTTAYVGFTRRGDANGDVYFDSIPNAQIVPEPATAMLTVELLLACVWWRRRK